jgi:plasmid maintenance system antidote protein VapI
MQVLLDRKVSKSAIARILGVHRLTVAGFVKGGPYAQTNRAAFATL